MKITKNILLNFKGFWSSSKQKKKKINKNRKLYMSINDSEKLTMF